MFSLFLNCQKEYSYAGFTQLPSPGKERFKKKIKKKNPVQMPGICHIHLPSDPKHHKWGGTLDTKSSFLRELT